MNKQYEDMSLFQFQKKSATEKACWEHLVKMRGQNAFVCSRCGHDKQVFIEKEHQDGRRPTVFQA